MGFKFNPLSGKLDIGGQGDVIVAPTVDPETTFINEMRVGDLTVQGNSSVKIVNSSSPSHIVLSSVTITSDGYLEILNSLSIEVA